MVSFFRSKNDLPLWNFTFRLLQGLAIAFVVAIVLMAGLRLLIESFKQLFGLDIDCFNFSYAADYCSSLGTRMSLGLKWKIQNKKSYAK